MEDTRSTHGWWQSNNIGARSARATATRVEDGKTRVLIFGDSYAHGSRVPQRDVWSTILERIDSTIDAVNLGADGYSMAQALLRYEGIADRVEHDVVVLIVVPSADLWRDINVVRDLAVRWNFPIVQPRAVVEGDSMRIIEPFYADPATLYKRDYPDPSPELLNHLRLYDRFYVPSLFEQRSFLSRLVLHKLAAASLARLRNRRTHARVWNPESEAVRVTRAIVQRMARRATEDGRASFLALILPTERDIDKLRKRPRFARRWARAVAGICDGTPRCVDLAPAFGGLESRCLDVGADGSHFGPSLNAALARAMLGELRRIQDSATHEPLSCDPVGP